MQERDLLLDHIVALSEQGDDDAAVQQLVQSFDPHGILVIRRRCMDELDSGTPRTRAMLRALDLIDDALDRLGHRPPG